ncbi:MAG: hypothetical protein RMK18_03290 [Armatimonadota bacterium]|nr:hypothetical protein [Armatimonadota bacterium]
MDNFISPVDDDERESEALQRVRKTLISLASWSTNLSLSEVAKLLIDECRFHIGDFGDAVKVAPVTDGRGIWSPVVVIFRLNDDGFPQAPSQFELLTDEHRKKLQQSFKLLTPLKLRSRLILSERMLFIEAIGAAAERLVLSYRRTDVEGKPQAPSVFLSAVENALRSSGWQWRYEERDLGDVLPRSLCESIDQRDAERKFLTSISDADFTVQPFKFDDGCSHCDFKAMCRHSKLRLTERRLQISEGESQG